MVAAPTAAPAEVAPEIAPSHFDTATELAPEREFETGAAAVHAGEPLASPAPLEPIEATPPPGAPPSAHAPLPPAAPPVTASDASPPPAPRERQLSGTAASPTASVPPTVSTESAVEPVAPDPQSELDAAPWTLVARGDEAGAALLARALANDPEVLRTFPAADLSIDRIGELLTLDQTALLAAAKPRV